MKVEVEVADFLDAHCGQFDVGELLGENCGNGDEET